MSTNKKVAEKSTAQKAGKAVKTAPKTKSSPKEVKRMEAEAIENAEIVIEPIQSNPAQNESVEETETNKALKPVNPTSPEYEKACLEVSHFNRLFIESLRERANALGTELKGESCGIREATPEIAQVNDEIKTAKQTLKELSDKRRELLNISPELATINRKVSEYRKSRSLARKAKKQAAAEMGM
jgi:hypothetical protein